MRKLLIIIVMVWLVLGINYGASAWISGADRGDTGWQTHTYAAAPEGLPARPGLR